MERERIKSEKYISKEKPGKKMILAMCFLLLVIIINFSVMDQLLNGTSAREVTYDKLLEELDNKNVDTVQIESNTIYFTLKHSEEAEEQNSVINKIRSTLHGETAARPLLYTNQVTDLELVNRLYESGAEFSQIKQEQNTLLSFLLNMIVSVGVPVLLFYFIMKFMTKKSGGGGNFMSFGKSNAKIYVQSVDGITFKDVAGEDEAKEALAEIVDYLHHPGNYTAIGAHMPKGALLVGPPGTGKTLLAKAVAGEAHVPFFSISGSEFVEMFVGMGAAKVRDLFKQASEKAPCIVFIDEIDTIGKKRDSRGITGNDEREQTLNQLLTEMDGFDASKGVVIIGASNRPDSLDPALLRPGRFDRRIPVNLPDLKGREEILRVHARKIKIGENVDFRQIARAASGASGADLANIVNESALRAVREGRKYVIQEDLEECIETVLAGARRKNTILSEKEKLLVSYHETGHALVASLQPQSAPVTKVSIIPRTSGALGYTLQIDEDEHNLMSKTELENKIATLTAGRAAEELIFGDVTTGASNDIEQATKLARAMISRFGMSPEIGMVAMEHVDNIYLGGDTQLQCSEALAEEIDRKVIALVKKQEEKAVRILKDHMDKLHKIAQQLFEDETIMGDELQRLLSDN